MNKKNQRILQEKYPDIYTRLEASDFPSGNFYLTKTKNNTENLVAVHEGQEVYLHSRYQPEREAEQWVKGLPNGNTLVIIGMGLGYILPYLAKRNSKETIIIIEPELEMFYYAMTQMDLVPYLDREQSVFLIGHDLFMNAHLLAEYLQQNGLNIHDIVFTSSNAYQRLYPDFVSNLKVKITDKILEFNVQEATYERFAKVWLATNIKNAWYLSVHPSVNEIVSQLQNLPVVIVSAGPSLEKNIDFLSSIKNKAVVIAVGSAINILEQKQIEPHIIMAIDSAESEARIFSNLSSDSSILVYVHSLHPDVVANYKGKKAWIKLKEDKAIEEVCRRLGVTDYIEVAEGPSVANIAFDFAVKGLKASVVLLIGQDLAYTENRTYAQGVVHASASEGLASLQLKEYKEEIDIYGNKVYTSRAFIAMKNFFEVYMQYEKPAMPVYNCTEGGLPLKGIPNISFKEAIESFCVQSHAAINEVRNIKLQALENTGPERVNKVWGELYLEAKELITLSDERIEELRNLSENQQNFPQVISHVIKLTEELEGKHLYQTMVNPYVEWFVAASTRKIQKEASLGDKNEAREVLVAGLLQQYEEIHSYISLLQYSLEANYNGSTSRKD